MLKLYLAVGLLIALACIQPVSAVPGPGVGQCDIYRHDDVVAIVAVIAGGDHETWSNLPGCGVARSNTQVFQWVGQYSGPPVLAGAVLTWGPGATFVGCTLSAVTSVNVAGAGGTSSTSTATLTMTSNECRGGIGFTINIGAGVYVWNAIHHINIRVEQPNFSFLCGATETTVNAYTPAQTCMEPQINNLNYLCAATLAVPDSFSESATTCNAPPTGDINFTAGELNFTFPSELAIQLCGPDFIDTGVCSPVEMHGEIDQTGNISLLFPLIIFLLIIIWAEATKDIALYLIAFAVGGAVIIGLWPEIEGMRIILISIVLFLVWRMYQIKTDPGDNE